MSPAGVNNHFADAGRRHKPMPQTPRHHRAMACSVHCRLFCRPHSRLPFAEVRSAEHFPAPVFYFLLAAAFSVVDSATARE